MGTKTTRLHPNTIAEIRYLAQEGLTTREIAEELGLGRSTVSRYSRGLSQGSRDLAGEFSPRYAERRELLAQAVAIAAILSDLGKLRNPSARDIRQAAELLGQRQGSRVQLTEELIRQVGIRAGQMIALGLLGQPLASHGPSSGMRGKRAA